MGEDSALPGAGQAAADPGAGPPAARAPEPSLAPELPEIPELIVEDDHGRRAPFDFRHAAASIARAAVRAGEPDAHFADEVARLVELCLARRPAERQPLAAIPALAVEELIERALVELGRAAIAKAYILERSERRRLGEVLRLERAHGAARPAGAPEVVERQGSFPWSRARIAAALVTEADLPRDAAEDVARRVEERVLALGQRRVATGLIRELVDGELVALGMHGALRRQEALRLPRHDLREILAGRGALAPSVRGARTSVAAEVASALLARYVREDVLGERARELCSRRELAIAGAGDAHLPLSLALPCELFAGCTGATGAASGGDARGAFALLDELAPALQACASALALEGAGGLLAGLSRGAREGSPLGLEAWLRALVALARASRRRIALGRLELAGAPAHHPALTARLVQALAEHVDADAPIQLALEDGELDALLGASPERADDVEALLERGLLELTFHSGHSGHAGARGADGGLRLAGLGCLRGARERGALCCAAAVGIDLSPAAARAGAFREDAFLEELAELVRVALEALAAIERHQRQHQLARPLPVRARATWLMVPLGLRAALKAQSGGSVDPAQAARWLGFLAEAARRFARPGDAPVLVDPQAAELFECGAPRIAGLTGRAGGEQQLLFAAAGAAPDPAHAAGRLGPVAGWWPLEAEGRAAAALAVGRLPRLEPAELADAGPRGRYVALEAWRRFRGARARATATTGARGACAPDLYAPELSAAGGRGAAPGASPGDAARTGAGD